MELQLIEQQGKRLPNLFHFCYVDTNSEHTPSTATGSYVVTSDGKVIFSRTVCLLTKVTIETEHALGDEFSEFKQALEAHFNPEFIANDCIVLSLELVRDRKLYDDDVLGFDERFGSQVYYADLYDLSVEGRYVTVS